MRLSRRDVLRASAAAALLRNPFVAAADAADSAETLAGRLHASLTPAQRKAVCFPWDHVHPKFGLLRTRVGNNWNVTTPEVKGDFFSKEQQQLVREIFERLIDPDCTPGSIDSSRTIPAASATASRSRSSASPAAGRFSSCSPAVT